MKNLTYLFADVVLYRFQVESKKLDTSDGNWLELCCWCGFFAISAFGKEYDGLERYVKILIINFLLLKH